MKMVRTSALTGFALLSAFTMVMALVPAAQQAGASNALGTGEMDAQQVQENEAVQEESEAQQAPDEEGAEEEEAELAETEVSDKPQSESDETEGAGDGEGQPALALAATSKLNATAADDSEAVPVIEITQSVDKDYYRVGDIVEYVVEIRQTVEGAVAKNVNVECTLPNGHDYVGDVVQTGYEGDLLVWDRTYRLQYSTLEYGQVGRLEFKAIVPERFINQVIRVNPTATGSNFTKTTDYLKVPVLGIENTGYWTTVKAPVDSFYEAHGQVVPVLKITETLSDGSSTTATIPINFSEEDSEEYVGYRGENCYCYDVVEEGGFYQASVLYTSKNVGSKLRFELVNCARYVVKQASSQAASYQYEDGASIKWFDVLGDQSDMVITREAEQTTDVNGVWQAEYDQVTSDTMTIYQIFQTVELVKTNQYGYSAARLVRNYIDAPENQV